MVRLILSIVILVAVSSLILADDPCKFTTSQGTIDISSLANNDNTPKYKDVQTSGFGFKYSFNPCKPFTEGTACIDAAVCQVSDDGKEQFLLAKQDGVSWDEGVGSHPTLKYTYTADQRFVNINLFCPAEGETESFDFIRESPPKTYSFDWKNKCACWNGCKGASPTPSGASGVSGGLVFIIILFAGLALYFVVFLLYNRFGRQQTGLEMIPHRGFWVGVPVYAKDGAVYIVRRITGKGGDYQSV